MMAGRACLTPTQITDIAHELRAPLGGIEAMVGLLEASMLDADQARIVAALRASLTHLREIAGAVLGAAGEEAATRDLGAVLAEIEVAASARAHHKGLAFRLHVAEDAVLAASVEPVALRQVLENLIDNAFRLTEAGAVDLLVSLISPERIGFRLVDDGPGLGADDAARMIRLGGRIEGHAGGAGIGLSIAGRIVAARGGVLSGGPAGEGRGAAFRFDWPEAVQDVSVQDFSVQDVSVQDNPAAETPVAAMPCAPAFAGKARGGKGTCLIVDDHPASRLVLRTILAAAGYACLEATRPEEAVALIAARRPDFILTDLHMPGGGGMALIAQVAAMALHPRPLLFIVSGDEPDIAPSLSDVVDGVIRKPITVRAVLEPLARLARDAQTCAA
jgi:CheY-like chemotaxis protein